MVARGDAFELVRSRSVAIAAVAFVCLVLGSWLYWLGSPLVHADSRPLLFAIQDAVLWTPLFALVLGTAHATDTAARTGRSSRPNRDGMASSSFIGALLGRAIVLVAVLSITVAGLFALTVTQLGTVAPSSVVGGLLALVLFGLAWLAPTVAISTAGGSTIRTVGVVLALYALCGFLWRDTVIALASMAVAGTTDPIEDGALLVSLEEPTWFLYLTRLNPFEAFDGAIYYLPRLFETLAGTPTSSPHLPNLFGIVALLAWVVVPIVACRWWIERQL
ncbi:hypothetical protein ACLI4Z_02985 [Natrialbaceae archaeon A-arb3/5]